MARHEGPIERPGTEALGGLDRLTIVEARLDLVDERLAERDRPLPPMSAAEARWLHQRDLAIGAVVVFVALVAAFTALGYWVIEAGKDALG